MDLGLGAQLAYALLLAIPVASVAWTVTQEELFKEVREKLSCYQKRCPDSIWRRKLAYMPTCPYCFSHYVGAFFVVLCHFPMLVPDWRGYLVSVFTVVMISNTYISGYNLLRAGLRALRARADEAEANARYSKMLAAACENDEPTMWNAAASLRDGRALRIGQRSTFPQRCPPNGSQHPETLEAPFEKK